ncbi:unnamed protein product [Plutella xylostella]|uniref:(diamondback moth) hypothetical protein n=1 Tax=Plutella xylostella TaxID=51655 RepID=A0A8S4G7D0_PLUXY|nr:unnamed protein product [Plutella xylostella]
MTTLTINVLLSSLGYLLKRYDRSWLQSLVLVAGGLRLAAAALLADARWLLPLELLLAPAAGALHGRGWGAAVLGDDSLQGTIATALEAIGSSLGMLVGGALYARAGRGRCWGAGAPPRGRWACCWPPPARFWPAGGPVHRIRGTRR